MFSFHKPRVYRSSEGCCICRAKSSSSRFTDSRKYEADSMKCFDLKSPRYGEICNACVLLVKRFKRLPDGSQRHWGHVVDARAGPGTKTITKIKRTKEETSTDSSNTRPSYAQTGKSVMSEKFSKIFKKTKNKKLFLSAIEERNSTKEMHKSPNKLHSKMTLFKRPNSIESDNEQSPECSPTLVAPPNIVQFQTQTRSSLYLTKNNAKMSNLRILSTNTTSVPRTSMPKISGSKRRKQMPPQKNRVSIGSTVKFFDDTEWSERMTCCGIVYECAKLPGTSIIDMDNYKCCEHHQHVEKCKVQTADAKKVAEKTQEEVQFTLPFTGSSANIKPTPVLKKHHLFYKRQSESFPHGDTATATTTQSTIKSNFSQTECDSQAINVLPTNYTTLENSLSNLPSNSNVQIAIVNPFDKPVLSTDKANIAGTKSYCFLHKIKSDAGKIVKHSIEKLNSAVRLKGKDISEMKHIVKPVDKTNITNIISKTTTSITGTKKVAKTSIATQTVPDLSPTSSSTKFNDNSSDSGFDENMQDRKSVSPLLQEQDTKAKIQPPIQTLILSSGVGLEGIPQNVHFAGYDATQQMLRLRYPQKNVVTSSGDNSIALKHNKHSNVRHLSTDPSTSQKLVKTKKNTNVVSIGPYNLAGVKMRAMYNNKTIKHENGITTIVPTSSINAFKRADAIMQTDAPNTVTITPASSSQIRLSTNAISTNYHQHSEGKKSIAKAHTSSNNQSQLNLNKTSLHQQFIVLKANPNVTFGHN